MSTPFEIIPLVGGAGWQQIGSQFAETGPHARVETATFRTPSRDQAVRWTVVHRKCGVGILPVLEDGRFVLLQQERIPVQRSLWEFPAGQIDCPIEEVTSEKITTTVHAELREEIGAELQPGGEVQPLGHYFTSPGFTQELLYLCMVGPVRIVAPPAPVGHEHIEQMRFVDFEQLTEMVIRNELDNSLSLALFAKLVARRQQNPR
jgi:ADP-ribose pyrophosphatase